VPRHLNYCDKRAGTVCSCIVAFGLSCKCGLQACWRNIQINGCFLDAFTLDPILFDLPRGGILQLDFVSYDVPALEHADLASCISIPRAAIFRVKPDVESATGAAAGVERGGVEEMKTGSALSLGAKLRKGLKGKGVASTCDMPAALYGLSVECRRGWIAAHACDVQVAGWHIKIQRLCGSNLKSKMYTVLLGYGPGSMIYGSSPLFTAVAVLLQARNSGWRWHGERARQRAQVPRHKL
jgi:hypothetical protein